MVGSCPPEVSISLAAAAVLEWSGSGPGGDHSVAHSGRQLSETPCLRSSSSRACTQDLGESPGAEGEANGNTCREDESKVVRRLIVPTMLWTGHGETLQTAQPVCA